MLAIKWFRCRCCEKYDFYFLVELHFKYTCISLLMETKTWIKRVARATKFPVISNILVREAREKIHTAPFWSRCPIDHSLLLEWLFFPGARFSKDSVTGPKSYFETKFSRKVGCVLISSDVHFVSLAGNLTVQFSNLLKLLSRMKNKTA